MCKVLKYGLYTLHQFVTFQRDAFGAARAIGYPTLRGGDLD